MLRPISAQPRMSKLDYWEAELDGGSMAKKAKAKKRGPVQLRKTSVTILGVKTKRGEKMLHGRYRLVNVKTKRVFVGTLVDTINKGQLRLAIFSVPKG